MIVHQNQIPIRPSRVVIIGALGFVGRKISNHLSDLKIPTVQIDLPEIDLLQEGSVESMEEIVKPEDVIVFTSALTPDKGKDRGTMIKNITMCDHVCRTLEHNGCSQIIYMSTDAVYGSNEKLLSETSSCIPNSLYGVAHLTREEMIKSVTAERKIPLIILRSCAVYGDGDTHNGYGPNRFIRSAIQVKKITLFGNGEEKRSHFFVGDLVRIIELCMMYKSSGILNMSSGKSISFMEVARKVAKVFNEDVEIVCTDRQNPISHIHFDPTELYKAFPGFRYTSIEEGIQLIMEKSKN